MLTNSLNSKTKKVLTFQKNKYINKPLKNQIKVNTRYSNIQNKSSAPTATNIYNNNQILYKSENKKGYNQMTIPTFSNNTDVLLVNPNTFTSISKGKISTQNSLNWNNIGFKEVKYRNNFSNNTYKPNLLNNYFLNNKNHLFQSYNEYNNYGATAKNLGFYNINSNINSVSKKNNNNILYSKKNNLINSYASTLTNSSNQNNNLKNNNKKQSLYEYYKNIIQIKNAREGVNSKIIKNRMTDEQNIKKINKIQAVWKGVYVRELMSYYWNFYKFQEKLENIFNNQYKINFFNELKKKGSNKNVKVNDNLLEEYNNILKAFNEYKRNAEKNKNNELNIEKNNFEILKTNKIITSEEIISNKYEEEKEENIKLKTINKINKKEFLQSKNNNLNIINNEQFLIDKIKKDAIFEINHGSFTLINNIKKEKIINIENKNEEKNKIFLLESQKGFNYEKNKGFNLTDLSIKNNNCLNIINKEKKVKTIPESKKYLNNLLISNNSEFIIKNEEKEKCDKMTEISDELNTIKTNEKIIIKENDCLEYIKVRNHKNNNITNYNSVNEIEKGDGLEINPYEIKRTKEKKNIISQQNNINVIVSNNIISNKSKKNFMKIILPIKLKEILLRFIKKNFFLYLIKELKKISFISILVKIKLNKEKKLKKKGMEKLREKIMMIKLKKYFEREVGKYKIQILAKRYLFFRWKKGLIDLSKNIINNKKK